MLEIAVSRIGLSPSEFWELSWYEWGLYLLRLKHTEEKSKQDFETSWAQTRIIWATMVNLKMPKNKRVKETDLIRLSFDGESKKDKPPKPGEVVKLFAKKGK